MAESARAPSRDADDNTRSSARIHSCQVLIKILIVTITFNPLNAELNPICHLLALLVHNFLHVSRIRVKSLTLIYGAPILDVSRSHTTTQHSR